MYFNQEPSQHSFFLIGFRQSRYLTALPLATKRTSDLHFCEIARIKVVVVILMIITVEGYAYDNASSKTQAVYIGYLVNNIPVSVDTGPTAADEMH